MFKLHAIRLPCSILPPSIAEAEPNKAWVLPAWLSGKIIFHYISVTMA